MLLKCKEGDVLVANNNEGVEYLVCEVRARADGHVRLKNRETCHVYPYWYAPLDTVYKFLPPPVLDLTKPLQNSYGQPVAVVGTRLNGEPIFEYDNRIFCNPNGIMNVPPPPVWPVSKFFITFEHNGKGFVHSKPSSSRAIAESRAKTLGGRRPTLTNITIKEVSFNGKA